MKKIQLLIAILSMAVPCMAMAQDYTVTLSDEQVTAYEATVLDVPAEIQRVAEYIANQYLEKIIPELTDKRMDKLGEQEKIDLLKSVTFEPASEARQAKPMKDRIKSKSAPVQ